jgi:hypothetical protein
LNEIRELHQDATQVEKYPEEDRTPIVKNLIMTMMGLMEGIDVMAKPDNSKADSSNQSQSRTFSKKSESRLAKQDILDNAITGDNDAVKTQIEEIDKRNAVIKKMRVKAQKGIFELEKRLNYVEEEIPEDQQPEVENLEDLDLNKEATITNKKYVIIILTIIGPMKSSEDSSKNSNRMQPEINLRLV